MVHRLVGTIQVVYSKLKVCSSYLSMYASSPAAASLAASPPGRARATIRLVPRNLSYTRVTARTRSCHKRGHLSYPVVNASFARFLSCIVYRSVGSSDVRCKQKGTDSVPIFGHSDMNYAARCALSLEPRGYKQVASRRHVKGRPCLDPTRKCCFIPPSPTTNGADYT